LPRHTQGRMISLQLPRMGTSLPGNPLLPVLLVQLTST
jgi:hypothetical protein